MTTKMTDAMLHEMKEVAQIHICLKQEAAKIRVHVLSYIDLNESYRNRVSALLDTVYNSIEGEDE